MKISKLVVCLLVIFVVVVFSSKAIPANGGKGKKTMYKGEIQMGQDSGYALFTIDLERIMLCLNSVQNKYKVIRIKINNESKKDLQLSKEKDKIDIRFEEDVVPGIIDLSRHDPKLWDTLDDGIRKTLMYPKIVETGEEENIFVFVPKPELKELPEVIKYTINSIPGKDIYIVMENLATAH